MKFMRFARWVMITGFGVASSGFVLALLSEDRSLGFGIFMTGFFLAGGGIVANMFSMPYASEAKPVLSGLRISAIGFGVVLFGSFIGLVFNENSVLMILLYGGTIIFIIGILSGIRSVPKNNR